MAWTKEAYTHAREWINERVQEPLERAGDWLREWAAAIGRGDPQAIAAAEPFRQLRDEHLAPLEAASGRAFLAELAQADFGPLDQARARAEALDRQLEEARLAKEHAAEQRRQAELKPEAAPIASPGKAPRREQESEQAKDLGRSRDEDLDLDLGY